MVQRRLGLYAVLVFLTVLLVLVCVRAAPQKHTFAVTGHPGEVPVVELGGRSYVDIEALTRLTNGSLSYKGHQIVLTLSLSSSNSHTTIAAADQTTGFTKDFLRAAIEQMSVIREWRSALVNAIQRGFPVTEDWTSAFTSQTQRNLRLVSVAVSNESDRNALQLLTNEFNNMKALSDRFVEANRSRNYVPPNALDNDPLDQSILNCGHALATMAANNQFVDDGSCH